MATRECDTGAWPYVSLRFLSDTRDESGAGKQVQFLPDPLTQLSERKETLRGFGRLSRMQRSRQITTGRVLNMASGEGATKSVINIECRPHGRQQVNICGQVAGRIPKPASRSTRGTRPYTAGDRFAGAPCGSRMAGGEYKHSEIVYR